MKKYFIFLILLLFSCEQKHEKNIDKHTMFKVLVDLHLSDAIIQVNSLQSPSVQVKAAFYDSIISSHGFSKDLFEWNLAYYLYTNELDAIMSEVVDTLNKMEGNLQKDLIERKESLSSKKQ